MADTASCRDTATRGGPKKRRAGPRARCWPNQMREVPAGAWVVRARRALGLVLTTSGAFGREPGTEWRPGTAEASSARSARLIPGPVHLFGPVLLRGQRAVNGSGHRPYLSIQMPACYPTRQPMCPATLRPCHHRLLVEWRFFPSPGQQTNLNTASVARSGLGLESPAWPWRLGEAWVATKTSQSGQPQIHRAGCCDLVQWSHNPIRIEVEAPRQRLRSSLHLFARLGR
jgi:hypothetical protein